MLTHSQHELSFGSPLPCLGFVRRWQGGMRLPPPPAGISTARLEFPKGRVHLSTEFLQEPYYYHNLPEPRRR